MKANGFKTYVQSGIDVAVSNNLRIDIALQVGELSQEVQVSATASMVETRENSISQVIDQARIVDLPLNGRQATDLIVLSGGAVNAPAGSLITTKNYPSSAAISVAGGAPTGNNYLLDGGDNNDAFTNVNLPYPFPDAVQEFSVQTSGLSARYGVHPGSVVNVVTKSGTNGYHGDVFEFLRNGDLDARNFFAPTHDSLRRNQFGGTVGGPILKDHLFFFFGYQGTTTRTAPTTSTAFVPTAAELNGDFSTDQSGQCQSSGKARSIINPSNGQPFANDAVPLSLFNSSALSILKYVPGSANACGKLLYAIPSPSAENQYIGRVDWTLSPKHSVFARYFAAHYNNPPFFDGNILTTSLAGESAFNQSLVVGDTYSFTPTVVNSVHLTGSRLSVLRTVPANAPSMTDFGVKIFQEVPHFSQICVTGDFSTGCGSCTPLNVDNNSFQAADDVDVIKGRHQLSFGVDFMHWQLNSIQRVNADGSFSFNGQFTNDPLLDFLLGLPTSVTQGQDEYIYFRQNYVGLYFHDNFRVSKKLNLNIGLRWEPFLPEADAQTPGTGDHFSAQAFAAGAKSTVFVNAPPGLTFFGDQGMPHGFGENHLADFEPRVGLAWDPTGSGRQSIRAAYGIFYDTPFIFYNAHMAGSSPFSANITVNAPSGGLTNPYASYPGGNPFPLPYPPSKNVLFPTAASYVSFPLDLPTTNVQQWDLSYQWQAAAKWAITATYLGNKTTHIWAVTEVDPAVYIPGTCGSGACSTVQNENQRRVLYLQNSTAGAYYASIGAVDPGANANYNGLLLKVEHPFNHNLTLISTFTHSHCISEGEVLNTFTGISYQNPADRDADRGNCQYDHRNVSTTSFVVASPRFHSRTADLFLGNWRLSSMIVAQSGTWFSVSTGSDASLTGVGLDRPNVVGNPYPADQSIQQWIRPGAFAKNAAGTFGNAGAYSLVGPGTFNTQFALSRVFTLWEGNNLELRFEAFNALNHVNFSNPSANLASSQFGEILSAGDPRILQLAMKCTF